MLHSDTAALIITYKRASNLEKLVNLCVEAGLRRIYIGSDGYKDHLDQAAVADVRREVDRLATLHPGKIIIKASSQNLGAALNVLSSCDWVFSKENFAVILEDDCIPSKDFFSFVTDYKDTFLINSDLYLICGSQFAPNTITNNVTSKSIYPMVWGWATSRDRWFTLTAHLHSKNFSKFHFFKLTSNDKTFWRAGARRAFEGYVDAWDIPMVKAIRDLNGKVLVPGSNLISNIGGDEHATHTLSGSKWLNKEITNYIKVNSELNSNEKLDLWIRKSIYGIGLRHQITTRATFIFDKLRMNRPKKSPLMTRWIRD